jgi:hypothetical protein
MVNKDGRKTYTEQISEFNGQIESIREQVGHIKSVLNELTSARKSLLAEIQAQEFPADLRPHNKRRRMDNNRIPWWKRLGAWWRRNSRGVLDVVTLASQGVRTVESAVSIGTKSAQRDYYRSRTPALISKQERNAPNGGKDGSIRSSNASRSYRRSGDISRWTSTGLKYPQRGESEQRNRQRATQLRTL